MDVQSPINPNPPSPSSSTTVPAPSDPPPPFPVHPPPTSDEIDAVIQQATSSVSSDGRHVPLKDTRTQLFVGNLPYRVRWQDLKDLFRKAGTVLRADVSLGPDNRSRGHGTVLLATAEDAGRAVDMFNGYSWQSRVLEVRLDRLPGDFDNFSNPTSGYHTPALISSHAPVIPNLRPSYVFPTALPPSVNPLSSSSFLLQIPLRGALDESYADHSTVFGHDRPTTAGSISRNLFVGNLPFHCQWQDLKDLFRQAGTILRADVALGQDGRSRGFGTVVFATEHDAERAVNMFNGYEYNGRPLKVHFDKFIPSGGQSSTAPSSPLLASSFPGVNTASLASMASINVVPTSCRATPLPAAQPPNSPGYSAFHMENIKSSTSPSPLNVFPSLARSQPQVVLSHMGSAPEHQHYVANHPTVAGLHDSMSSNPPLNRKESPAIGFGDLPTPPSSSAGVPSVKGLRVSSPPVHLLQPLQSLSQPSLKHEVPSHPPPQSHTVSMPHPLSLSTSLISTELGPSLQTSVSASQTEAPSRLQQASPHSRQRAHTHPAHPGPISLPPPSAFVIPAPTSPVFAPGVHVSPLQRPVAGVLPNPSSHRHPPPSPLHHPMSSHARSPLLRPVHGPLNMTPSGLPPITPSMPSFQFAPGPPTLSHPGHPSVALSPVLTMSPGAFWGRPGGNPLTNAAVGAPVTKGQSGEEFDYFSGASTEASEGENYFPPPQTASSPVNGILRNEPQGCERSDALRPATEDVGGQEVSMSSGSGEQSGADERTNDSSANCVIERSHDNLKFLEPGTIPRMEERAHDRAISPFHSPPPTRRTGSDPAQEQGRRQSRSGIERRASFTEVIQGARSEKPAGLAQELGLQ